MNVEQLGQQLASKEAKIKHLQDAIVSLARAQNPQVYEKFLEARIALRHDLEQQLSAKSQEILDGQTKLRDAELANERLLAQIATIQDAHSADRSTLVDSHEAKLRSVNEEAVQVLQRLEAQNVELRKTIFALQEDEHVRTSTIKNILDQHTTLQTRAAELEQSVTNLTSQKADLDLRLALSVNQNQEFRDAVKLKDSELSRTADVLDAEKAWSAQLQSRIANLDNENARLRAERGNSTASQSLNSTFVAPGSSDSAFNCTKVQCRRISDALNSAIGGQDDAWRHTRERMEERNAAFVLVATITKERDISRLALRRLQAVLDGSGAALHDLESSLQASRKEVASRDDVILKHIRSLCALQAAMHSRQKDATNPPENISRIVLEADAMQTSVDGAKLPEPTEASPSRVTNGHSACQVCESIRSKFAQLNDEYVTLRTEMSASQKQLESTVLERDDAMTRLRTAIDERTDALSQVHALNAQCEDAKAFADSIGKECDTAVGRAAECERIVDERERTIKQLQETNEQLRARVFSINVQLEGVRSEPRAAYVDEISTLFAENASALNSVRRVLEDDTPNSVATLPTRLRNCVDACERRHAEVRNQKLCNDMEKDLVVLREKLSVLKSSKKDAEQAMRALLQEQQSKDARFASKEQELADANAQVETLKQSVKTKEQELANANTQLVTLKRQKSMASNGSRRRIERLEIELVATQASFELLEMEKELEEKKVWKLERDLANQRLATQEALHAGSILSTQLRRVSGTGTVSPAAVGRTRSINAIQQPVGVTAIANPNPPTLQASASVVTGVKRPLDAPSDKPVAPKRLCK